MKRIRLPEIDEKRFYTIGKYAFFTMGLIGLIRILDLWNELKSYDVFSSLASTIFSLILAAFFAYLGGKQDVKELDDTDIFKMDEALKKLDLEGGEKNAKDKPVPIRSKKKSGRG